MTIVERISKSLRGIPAEVEGFERTFALMQELAQLSDFEASRNRTDVFCFEHKITLGLFAALDEQVQKLSQVAPLDLTIAPVVVDLLPVDAERRRGVLVTRYLACEGERLRSTDDLPPDVPQSSFDRFYADVEKLAENGFLHPLVRGWYHVLVSSESKTLVMDDWLVSGRGSPGDIEEMLQHARRMTGREDA